MNLVMKIVEWWMMQKGQLNIIYEVYILLEFPLFFYILYKNFMSTWVIIVEGGASSHILILIFIEMITHIYRDGLMFV